jgi:hypothetical protein
MGLTTALEDAATRATKPTKNGLKPDQALFSYVILTSDSVAGQAAHLKNAGRDSLIYAFITVLETELNDIDKNKIKSEVLGSKFVPIELQNFIKTLE